MEDISFVEIPFGGDEDRGLFCVFDGHAGKRCAEAAAKILPLVIITRITLITH
jgi:serine/threonine protein phosphatase PrpC